MALEELDLPNDLGRARDIDVIDRLISVAGLDIVDVGTFNGGLAKALAKRGATVLGLEPDPVQAEKNKTAEMPEGVTLIEGRAEAMPCEDGSVDGVFFSKSLHHGPAEAMDMALRETARVLKPDGFAYFLEPDIRSPFSQMIKPVHDETVVRAQALAALSRTADRLFDDVDEYWYTITNVYPDFETFRQRLLGNTFNDHKAAAIDSDEIRTRFAAGAVDGECRFDNLMRVRLYRRPRRAV